LRFFLDESVPAAVGEALSSAGHTVIKHHDALQEGANDIVVCQTAVANEAVLVAVDGDMRYLTQRYGKHADDRFKNLSLLMCGCGPVMAPKRVEYALSLIEHEWDHAEAKAGRRLWIEVEKHKLVTHR
jgi:predicted nuclease of predicted toxin-antitoxin system